MKSRMMLLILVFTLIAAFALQTSAVASQVGSENTSVLNASTFEPIDPGALNVSVFSDSIQFSESSGNELTIAMKNQTELNAMLHTVFENIDNTGALHVPIVAESGKELITEIQTELNAMFLRLFEINDKLIEEDIFANQGVNQQAIVNGAMTVQIDDLSGQLVFDSAASGSLRWNHAGVNGVYLYVVTGQAANGSLTRSIRELVV